MFGTKGRVYNLLSVAKGEITMLRQELKDDILPLIPDEHQRKEAEAKIDAHIEPILERIGKVVGIDEAIAEITKENIDTSIKLDNEIEDLLKRELGETDQS